MVFRGRTEIEVFRKIASYQGGQGQRPTFSEAAQAWLDAQEQRFEDGRLSFNTLKGTARPCGKRKIILRANLSRISCPNSVITTQSILLAVTWARKPLQTSSRCCTAFLDFACVQYNLPYNPSDKVKVPDGLHRGFRACRPTSTLKSCRQSGQSLAPTPLPVG